MADYLRDGPVTKIELICGPEFKRYITDAAHRDGMNSVSRWCREVLAAHIEASTGVPAEIVLRDTPRRPQNRPRRDNGRFSAYSGV